MKRVTKILGILLVLTLAGNAALLGQRGMRGMMTDSTRMHRMRMANGVRPDSSLMRGQRQGRGPGLRPGMNYYMNPRQMYGMHRGMYGMRQDWMYPRYRMGRGMQPGMGMGPGNGMRPQAPWSRILDNIPNLTDKQKKEITDLRQKQRDEMQKFRDENAAKIKSMQEAHRSKIMNVLTDEQKKWVEDRSGIPATSAPAKK
jgi:hypothetical protein